MFGILYEAGNGGLQSSFCVCNKGIIIGKAEVSDRLLCGFRVCFLSSLIKQATIETVSDVDSVSIIKIFRDLFEHHAEEDGDREVL